MSVLERQCSSWPVSTIAATFVRVKEQGFGGLEPLSVYLEAGVVPRASRDDNHNQLGSDLEKYQRVCQGDLVFNKLRTWQGGFGYSSYTGIVSPAYYVLRPRSGSVDSRFVDYVLHSSHYLSELTRISKWMPPSQFDTGWEDLKSVSIPLPPLETQRKIAAFLDDQVSRVDQAVAARKRQIELVGEEFRSFRSLSIRGTVDQENAGSDFAEHGSWIGVHSPSIVIRRLGSVATTCGGTGFPDDEQGLETGDYPFLKVADLANSNDLGQVGDAANWIDREAVVRLGARPVEADTILFPKVGAALLGNRRAILTRGAVFDNNIMGLQFVDSVATRYALHVLSEIDMAPFANPGPVPSVNESTVEGIPFPVPSFDEQRRIAASLDRELENMNRVSNSMEEGISLLTELKSSLISAAVLGEFDVSTADGSGVPV